MTRSMSTAASDQLDSNFIGWAVFLDLALDSGTVYVWSGTGDYSFNGQTYLGIGALGSITGVPEPTDLSDARIKATLRLIDDAADALPDFVSELADGDPVGRSFTLYLGVFDDAKAEQEIFTLTAGFIDAVELVDGPDASISIDLASELALLDRRKIVRMNDQAQQKLFSGDKFFQYVTELDGEITWGNVKTNVDSGPSLGSGSDRGSTSPSRYGNSGKGFEA